MIPKKKKYRQNRREEIIQANYPELKSEKVYRKPTQGKKINLHEYHCEVSNYHRKQNILQASKEKGGKV